MCFICESTPRGWKFLSALRGLHGAAQALVLHSETPGPRPWAHAGGKVGKSWENRGKMVGKWKNDIHLEGKPCSQPSHVWDGPNSFQTKPYNFVRQVFV